MPRILTRGLTAGALAIATLAAPIATVHACSCMEMQPPDAIEFADLAFVGTVAETAPGGQDPMMGVPLVRYAFEVERASEPTGPVVEVAAPDDGGGASCGFTFGVGERWFVAATSEDGVLRSHLCSGNIPMEGMDAAQMAQLVELLPMEPSPATPAPASAPSASEDQPGIGMPVLAAVIGLFAAGALAFVLMSLRRGRSS